MQRRFKDYLLISLKGVAMGAADAVPGVSGGTIAFISGIYQELINSISGINLDLLKTLKSGNLKKFWEQANGNFLLALLIGIIVSFVSFMQLAKYLIEEHPVLIWSFFFGLVIASIFFVGKQIKQWRLSTYLALIVGAILAFYITTLPSLATTNNPYFLALAGAIAICAMILPGISGSFILVILGAYKLLSDAIHDRDIKNVALFAGGALVGLLSFSRLLKWLFKHYETTTLAILTGFIFGSLNKIWPYKNTLTVMDKESGHIIPLDSITDLGTLSVYQKSIANFDTYKTVLEESTWATTYETINNGESAQVFIAITLMVTGFLTIFILEKIGKR